MSSNSRFNSVINESTYLQHSKAIGVLWSIFTACYAAISAIAFFAPEWIAHETGTVSGRIGLWSVCEIEVYGQVCSGKLDNFMSFPGKSFQAATFFVGLAAVSAVLSICAMLFFLCCHSSTVFFTCAWMQLFSGICMLAGCATFPLGWNEDMVRKICEDSDRYILGHCDFRWGYLLAIIGSFDAFILCFLAFILAIRYTSLQPDDCHSLNLGQRNAAYLEDSSSALESRKFLNLHPLLLMHQSQEDICSQYSQRTTPGSTRSTHYLHGHLPYSAHNFQI